jgi:hypothetical protein
MAQAGQPAAALAPAVDVGSTFTYQGLLQQNGAAFDGSCDIEFRLFDALTVGTQVGATQTKNAQAVSKGRFTSALDFGANAFNGQARWLEIAVRCPSGSGIFTTLAPGCRLRRPTRSVCSRAPSLRAMSVHRLES